MPKILKNDDTYEFTVDIPEDEENYKTKCFVYLEQCLLVEEVHETDWDEEETIQTYVSALADVPGVGLAEWNPEDCTWDPVHKRVQEEYIGYLTEREILTKKEGVKNGGAKRK